MTVTATTSSATWAEQGSAGPYPIHFKFLANTDIKVYRISAAGAETLLTEGVDYTLAGAGDDNGGAITLLAPQNDGGQLTARRYTDMRQLVSIANQGAFYPAVFERVFDRLSMCVQDYVRRIQEAEGDIDDLEETADDHESRILTLENRATTVVVTGGTGTVPKTFVDASVGPTVAELPEEGEIIIIKTDATANVVTVTPTVGKTVMRAATFDLTLQDEAVRLVSSGNNWYRVG